MSSKDNSNDRQNISFTFSKMKSKALSGNRLDENTSKNKDFVTSVEESEIKSSIHKEKSSDLVIPLIRKNNWRGKGNTNDTLSDEEKKIKELAIQELLKETEEKNREWDNREFTNYAISIPLIMQNKVPDGFETEEKMDVSLRADESKLEDYDRVPVEKFGLAMLRGMGWKEGDGIGNKKAVEPVQAELRPKGLGLGADASKLKKSQKKAKDEKLEMVKGAFVNITQGSHKGFYGEVLGLDEENGRAIVKLSGDGDKTVTFPEFYLNLVTKKEFEKESKIINRAAYESYKRKREQEEKEDLARRENEKKRSRNSHKEKSRDSHRDSKERSRDSPIDSKERSTDSPRDSLDDRKRHRDDSDEKSSRKSEHSKKRRNSKERRDNYSNHEEKKTKVWVRPQLKVRFIDENYKKGRYFNNKVVVVDVLSSRSCSCKTEDGKYLDDISPSMLETVIPRDESAYVMIVEGKYTGELCTILKKDKSQCLATVQFLSDRSQVIKIEYDSICEYVGDVAQYD